MRRPAPAKMASGSSVVPVPAARQEQPLPWSAAPLVSLALGTSAPPAPVAPFAAAPDALAPPPAPFPLVPAPLAPASLVPVPLVPVPLVPPPLPAALLPLGSFEQPPATHEPPGQGLPSGLAELTHVPVAGL